MDQPTKNFRTCALASKLVTPAELDQAIASFWSKPGGAGSAQVEISDQELADKLVEMGRLTRYQATQLLAGRTKLHLSQYRILESIGHGGMGEVFKAEHEIMGRIVAIKVLPRSKSTPESIASFMHEIRTQAKLHHENLVQAFDAGHDGNVYFLVTEYVPGTDLRKYVRDRGMLSMYEAATIISQAAKGLAHAHSQGLIHRDVKPGNLLVTPEGTTKLSDLGLAGWLNQEEIDPRAGKIVGTADYLAPEQITSPRDVTVAADIYSLGCTMYYAVTGKVPFPGGTTKEKARRHLEDVPLHPARLNPDLTGDFVELIAEMMDKNPKERLQTADEVVNRLTPWAGDHVITTIADPASRRLPPIEDTAQAAPLTEVDLEEEFTVQPDPEWESDEASSQGSSGQFSHAGDTIAATDEETAPESFETWLPRRTIRKEVLVLGFAAGFAILTLLLMLISALMH